MRQKQVSNLIEEQIKRSTMFPGLKLPDKDKNNLVNETFFVKEPVIHDVYKTINNLRIKNIKNIIIATLNVNSIIGKFKQLKNVFFTIKLILFYLYISFIRYDLYKTDLK